MATYCAKFIPNFSDLTFLLRELTKQNASFTWTSKHKKAFFESRKPLQVTVLCHILIRRRKQKWSLTLHRMVYQVYLHRQTHKPERKKLLLMSVGHWRLLNAVIHRQNEKLLELYGLLNDCTFMCMEENSRCTLIASLSRWSWTIRSQNCLFVYNDGICVCKNTILTLYTQKEVKTPLISCHAIL